MNCLDCFHKAHEPGQCDSCNCGESGLVHLTSFREISLAPARPDHSPFNMGDSTMTLYGYDCGHRVPKRRTY